MRHANKKILKEIKNPPDSRISYFVQELENELQNKALPCYEQSNIEWTDFEITKLLYGVFKFGEGQWTHILEGNEF